MRSTSLLRPARRNVSRGCDGVRRIAPSIAASAMMAATSILQRVATRLALLAAGLTCAASTAVTRAEVLGQVGQPLVAGTEVSVAEQQKNALVRIRSRIGRCSGVLWNNHWAMTATHCLKDQNNKFSAAEEIFVEATWATPGARSVRDVGDDWFEVAGRGVPGGKGFVYSGPSYKSLEEE